MMLTLSRYCVMLTLAAIGASGRLLQAHVASSADPVARGTHAFSPYNAVGDALLFVRAQLAEADADASQPCFTDVHILLHGGVHSLQSTITLSAAIPNLRRCSAPRLRLASADGERARLSGGVVVTGWIQVQNGVYIAPLPPGMTATPTQLWVNGQRRIRARSPNVEPSPFSNAEPSPILLRGDAYTSVNSHHWARPLQACSAPSWGTCPAIDRYGFVFNPSDMPPGVPSSSLVNASVLVFGAWTAEWATIGSVSDANSTIMFTGPTFFPVGAFGGVGGASGGRFIVENAAPLLDAPGEWFVDPDLKVVSYMPLAWEDMSTVTVTVPNLKTLVTIEVQVGVQVENVELSYTQDDGMRETASEPSTGAIMMSLCSNVSIVNVTVAHTGSHGIYIDAFVTDVVIDGCWIGDTGGDGISMTGGEPVGIANVTVTNSIIVSTGNIYMIQPTGIRLKGSAGIVASHNDVSDTPYSGIALGWQSGTALPPSPPVFPDAAVMTVTYNHIHEYGQGMLNDFGGVYISAWGPDNCWINPDPLHGCYIPTYVGNNLIHGGRHFNYGSNNVYLDEAVAGVMFDSNILYDTGNENMDFHCGMFNAAVNNIVATAGVQTGGWSTIGGCNTGGFTPRDNTSSITLLRNIFIVTNNSLTNSNDWYYVADFDNNTYWTPPASSGSLVFPGSTSWSQWQAQGQDVHSGVDDPQVADWTLGNFTVLPSSPAWARGWQAIDSSSYGPVGATPLLPLA